MYVNEIDGTELVLIPAGPFNDMPNRYGPPKYLEHFYIARSPVLVKQFRNFAAATENNRTYNRENMLSGDEERPVTGVTYEEAEAYFEWAGLRLPTEHEWVKAAYSHYWGLDMTGLEHEWCQRPGLSLITEGARREKDRISIHGMSASIATNTLFKDHGFRCAK